MKRTHSWAIFFVVVILLTSLAYAQFQYSITLGTSYNTTTYDTSFETFLLTLTYPANQSNVNATLVYDNTARAPTTKSRIDTFSNWSSSSLGYKLLFNHGFNHTINATIGNYNITYAHTPVSLGGLPGFRDGINNASIFNDFSLISHNIQIAANLIDLNDFPEYTISFWVNHSFDPNGYVAGTYGNLPLIWWEESAAFGLQGFDLTSCGVGNVSYYYGTGTTNLILCGHNVTDNNWQLLTFIKNATGIQLYINGTLVDNKTTNLIGNTQATLEVLSRNPGAYNNQSSIDELNFWNRSLTSSEVSSLYNMTFRYGSSTSQSTSLFSTTLEIPAVSSTTNKTFYWNFSSNEYSSALATSNTSFYNQTVNPINFGNSPISNLTFLRLVFKDEISNTYINASIDTSTWHYTGGTGSGTNNKTFTYSNTSEFYNHSFGAHPNFANLRIQGATLRVSSTGYSSKTWTIPNSYYTNTSLANITIWLTSLADSGTSPVTFQVLDSVSNVPLSGARIQITRVIAGNLTVINDGQTDDSGAIAYYLSPIVAYTVSVSRSGCTSSSSTITPTNSLYSVFLSCQGSVVTNATFISPVDGIFFQRTPKDGVTNPGHYTFGYYVNSSIYNLTSVRFELVSKGSILAINVTNTTSSGICSYRACTLTLNYTLVDADQIKGRYYVMTNQSSNWIILEGDAYWKVIYINTTGSLLAVNRFFQNFQELVDSWGSYECLNHTTSVNCIADTKCRWLVKNMSIPWNGTAGYLDTSQCIASDQYNKREFDRFLIVFFALAVLIIFLSSATGYDMAHPGAFTIIFTLVVIGLSYYGVFYYNGLTESTTINKYIFAIASSLWSAATIISFIRRQNG